MTFYDMRAEFERVKGDFPKRDMSRVRYIAVHHSGDRSAESPGIKDAARAIQRYHRYTKGWSGIGYHYIELRGDIAYVGDISTSRANVLDRNHEVIGICILGNYLNSSPSPESLDAVNWLVGQIRRMLPHNDLMLAGHYELNPGHTECPGHMWPHWKGRLMEPSAPVLSTTPYNTVNGFVLGGGFRSRYEALGALALPTLGYPVANEETALVDGTPRTIQRFERAILAWYPEGSPDGVEPSNPFHVRCLTLSEIEAV